MTTYSIKVLKEGRTLTRKQITKGITRTDAAVVRAAADQAYVISDALLESKAPAEIKSRRVGQDLHISFGSTAIDAPDLIIERYFDFPPGPLLGALNDGSIAPYDMSSIVGMAQEVSPTRLAESSGGNSTGAVAESTLSDPQPYAGMSGLQVAGAIGLGALALSGGKGGGGSDPASAPSAAQTAQAKISTFADQGTQPAPNLSDYTALGIQGVTANNLSAINSALDALTANEVNSAAKIQSVVDAYMRILAEANGTTADATPGNNPSAANFATIGVSLGATSTDPENQSLLNSVIGEKTAADVDSIAELNALADAVNAVMACAAGTATAPSVLQLQLLNVTGITTDNLALVQAAIAESADNGTGVDSLAELQAVVNTVNSLATITNYATSNVNTPPTLADYTQAGVVGVSSSNVNAINSAVDSLNATSVNTSGKLQLVVDAYAKILAEANGTTADITPTANPFASDFAAIGAEIGTAQTNTYALALLDDVIGGLNTTSVDTVGEINGIAQVVDKIMTTASGGPSTLTVADFNTIGIATAGPGAVNNVNLSAVVDAITHAGGQSHVGGLATLQTLVSAVATIVSYADSNTNTVPTVATFTNAGLSGVTVSNLGAINSALDAKTATDVDTKSEVQTTIDAYIAILAEANGATADATPTTNPTVAQYNAIGANIGSAASDAESLTLLNDVVANLTTSGVDTIAEINALASTVDKIMTLAALPSGSAIPTSVPSMAELTALGLNTTLANTVAEQNAIWQAFIDSNDSGNAVTTILQLQALIDAHAS